MKRSDALAALSEFAKTIGLEIIEWDWRDLDEHGYTKYSVWIKDIPVESSETPNKPNKPNLYVHQGDLPATDVSWTIDGLNGVTGPLFTWWSYMFFDTADEVLTEINTWDSDMFSTLSHEHVSLKDVHYVERLYHMRTDDEYERLRSTSLAIVALRNGRWASISTFFDGCSHPLQVDWYVSNSRQTIIEASLSEKEAEYLGLE